jgi:hypothetical protein
MAQQSSAYGLLAYRGFCGAGASDPGLFVADPVSGAVTTTASFDFEVEQRRQFWFVLAVSDVPVGTRPPNVVTMIVNGTLTGACRDEALAGAWFEASPCVASPRRGPCPNRLCMCALVCGQMRMTCLPSEHSLPSVS